MNLGKSKNVIYYAATVGLQAILGFLTIPILIRLVGVVGYGRWSLIEPIYQFAAQLGVLGGHQGAVKLIAADKQNPFVVTVRIFYRTLLPLSLVAAVCGGGFYKLGILGGASAIALFLLVVSEGFLVIQLYSFRAANKASLYAALSLVRSLMVFAFIAIAHALAPTLVETVDQVVFIWAAIWVALFIVTYIFLRRRARIFGALSKSEINSAIAYGLPLMGAIFLAFLLQNVDRYAINHLMGEEYTGVYSIHLKIASLISFVTMPIQLWWPTARFNHLGDPDGGVGFFSQLAERGLLFYLLVATSATLVAPFVFKIFAPAVIYLDLAGGLLIFSAAITSAAIFFNIGLLQVGQTHKNMWTVGSALLVQVLLLFLLIPRFGIGGAAFASFFTSILSLLSQCILSQRVLKINIRTSRLLGICCCFLFVNALIFFVRRGLFW